MTQIFVILSLCYPHAWMDGTVFLRNTQRVKLKSLVTMHHSFFFSKVQKEKKDKDLYSYKVAPVLFNV